MLFYLRTRMLLLLVGHITFTLDYISWIFFCCVAFTDSPMFIAYFTDALCLNFKLTVRVGKCVQ